MKPVKIAVLGADGQLGTSLKNQTFLPEESWIFFSIQDLDITNKYDLSKALNKENGFSYVINCAAYTTVDLAESESEKAHIINAEAVKSLAEICRENKITLIHISTDFVFDGKISRPLKESDKPNPLNEYGKSKLQGELYIAKTMQSYFILRTGWLYSKHKNNFLKTILRLAEEKESISIVSDQVGTPTHTSVLTGIITRIIRTDFKSYGLYHVANEGVASWYDFAYEILNLSNSTCQITPILTEDYPLPALRPSFSVLNKSRIKNELGISIPHWKESLKAVFRK